MQKLTRLTLFTLLMTLFTAACNLSAATPEPQQAAQIITQQPVQNTLAPTTALATNGPAPTVAPTLPPTAILPESVCAPVSNWPTYTVQAGDTLFSIAQAANSSVNELVTANCLNDADVLDAGQVLYVPNEIDDTVEVDSIPGRTHRHELGYNLEAMLVTLGDNGVSGIASGCGHSLMIFAVDAQPSGDLQTDMRRRFEQLLALDTGFSLDSERGQYNAFAEQNLTLQDLSITGDTLTLRLSGDFLLIGACYDGLLEDQLLANIFVMAPGIERAIVTINGQNAKQLFDMSGLIGPDEVYTRTDAPSY